MNIELREYVDGRGRNHYRDWMSKLDASVRARIDKSIFQMAYGNFSGAKPEVRVYPAMRLDFGPGYRIYFGQDGETLVILLAGGTKRRQANDIKLARRLWTEYKRRKREGKREK